MTIINADEEQVTVLKETRKILKRYGRQNGNLVPILQQIQGHFGYIPCQAMIEVARFLKVPEIDVYGVVTFYNQFKLNPPGKHHIRVCLGTACHMKGGYIVLDAWKRRLGIDRGETTPDRQFDLDTVACVGCCTMAPVTVVDDEVEAKTSPTRVDGILLSYKLGKRKDNEKPDEVERY